MKKETFVKQVQEAEDVLYRVARTILMEEEDCEDAVQNAILHAYEKLETLRQEQCFKTWLVRIMINECYKIQRTQKSVVSYEEYFENRGQEKEDFSELYQAILRLKPKVRITVVLFYVEGYSVLEIKDILKVPAGTVKSRLSKGRKELKRMLEESEQDCFVTGNDTYGRFLNEKV